MARYLLGTRAAATETGAKPRIVPFSFSAKKTLLKLAQQNNPGFVPSRSCREWTSGTLSAIEVFRASE